MEEHTVRGDGQHLQAVLDWLVANAGPYQQISHPFDVLVGPGYNMQRMVAQDSWPALRRGMHYTYKITLDDPGLITAYKLRWS